MYACPDCACVYLELVFEGATITKRGRHIPGTIIFELEKETEIEEQGKLAEVRCLNKECRYAGAILEFNTESEEKE